MGEEIKNTDLWQAELEGRSPEEILLWAWHKFQPRVAFASSLGLEDQALTDMIANLTPGLPVFTLDTGRLFQESYDLLERTESYLLTSGDPDARKGLKIPQHTPSRPWSKTWSQYGRHSGYIR